MDCKEGTRSILSPVTVTVNLHLARFPEGSVDDTYTVVIPILTLNGRFPMANPAGDDSIRGRNPELSENVVSVVSTGILDNMQGQLVQMHLYLPQIEVLGLNDGSLTDCSTAVAMVDPT